MEIEADHRATHDFYWERLKQADRDDVCVRSGTRFDPQRSGYVMPILDGVYLVAPEEKKIFCMRGGSCREESLRDYFYLMALLYLLDAKPGEPVRKWISEKELKGGTTFFRGPHALQVEELIQAFGKDAGAFGRAGARLGGVELLFGDKSFALTVFPKVPLAYVLWEEDAEFPCRVTVMFDATIQDHFSLDGIWCMVAEVSRRLVEAKET